MSQTFDEDEPRSGLKPPPNRHVRVPTVLQMENVECGAAALAIILEYHGRIVPLEELRVECGVSRDGSKAINMVKAAQRYGLKAKGRKFGKIENLYDLDLPLVLFWNQNHFLVLAGFKNGKAILSDPAQGPRTVSLEEFDLAYSGVVLTFEPGRDFEPGGGKRSRLNALRQRLRGSYWAMTFALICGLFLVVPGLITPAFTRVFIDEYLVAGRPAIIKPLIVGMLFTAMVSMALRWLQEYYLLKMEMRLANATSSRFFQHILRLPMMYFGQRFAGEIGARVMINEKVARMITGRLATTTIDCLMVVFYGALMFFYDVELTLLVIALAACNVAALMLVARLRIDASRRLAVDRGKLEGTAASGLNMIETLKATGGEADFFSRWAGYQAKTLRAEQRLQLSGDLISIVPVMINALITASVLLFGGHKAMAGEFTVGLLVAYQSLTGFFTRPLTNLVGFGSAVQELEADMNRLDDVLRYEQDPVFSGPLEPAAADRRLKLRGKVEIDGISFGYSPLAKPLIQDFSLTIEPGQRVALIGASGSGKSTLARLVAGLYEPLMGSIRFDGLARREIPRRLFTNSVSIVDQEIFLFRGTIRDNVAMWERALPLPQLEEACRDAVIAEVIQERESKYLGPVLEGGSNFSGGQRQRLEIARALARRPSVLILDEATSALDPTTEELIDENLKRRGCTCIVIAHRLSTFRDCDHIVLLQNGKIVQQGTHQEMLQAPNQAYRRFIGQQ